MNIFVHEELSTGMACQLPAGKTMKQEPVYTDRGCVIQDEK